MGSCCGFRFHAFNATVICYRPGVTVVPGNARPSLVPSTARSVDAMTQSDDVRKFLTSRRARITPEEAGLPVYGGNRRVTGLRREEVAMLAGMSIDYYIRLERGNLSGASDSVLEALGRALKLDEAETAHLFDLARAATAAPRVRRKRSPQTVRPSVQRVIDAITAAPAWVRNDRGDVLAANELGRALYLDLMAERTTPPNSARFTFLNPKGAGVLRRLGTRGG